MQKLSSVMLVCLLSLLAGCTSSPSKGTPTAEIKTVAIRVKNLDAMVAFYSEAFGCKFSVVDTFGIKSRFGNLGSVQLKLVPIRKQIDFEGFGEIQLGLAVQNVRNVIRIATKHGGKQEGKTLETNGLIHAAIRDPDGNTLEIYETISP